MTIVMVKRRRRILVQANLAPKLAKQLTRELNYYCTDREVYFICQP